MKNITLSAQIKEFINSAENRPIFKRCGTSLSIDKQTLVDSINKSAQRLEQEDIHLGQIVVAIAIDPSFDWIVCDLLCISSDSISIPIPTEFTNSQIEHLLQPAEYCFVNSMDMAERINQALPEIGILFPDGQVFKRAVKKTNVDDFRSLKADDVFKIIHTSGTTSSPKGVLIRDLGLGTLVATLREVYQPLNGMHYYSMVPFSLLIEQVLAVYLPLLSGGSTSLLPMGLPPFSTQSGIAERYLATIPFADINCVYLPPKLLEETLEHLRKDSSLKRRFFGEPQATIMTGGAKVSVNILEELASYGVTVDEGYGLSENSSVVALNRGVERKLGTVGRLLPGVEGKIVDGELLIKSETLCAGYSSRDVSSCDLTDDGFLHTGDIAHFDDENYLVITGRKKNVIILSNGRNVSPEWVEATYKEVDGVADVVVFGEAQEAISGVIFTDVNSAQQPQLLQQIQDIATQLPGYSQLTNPVLVNLDSETRKSYFTVTGRPKRNAIYDQFMLAQAS